nr:hypothetical protein [uncultured Aminipila sp.]
MRKKRIGAALVALVVAVGIPSSAFAANIADNEVAAGVVESVTTNNEMISTTQSNESTEQNKDTVKDESGNLPEAEVPVIEKPAAEQPTVEEPKVEAPVVQEPVAEKPAVEEPVVTEPAIEAEEPVATEPAIVVEEPVVTEPAIVTEELVVTEPAIVVEPAPAKLTVTHILKLDTGDVRHTETIEGIQLGSNYDISALINETEEIKCVSDVRNVQMDELEKVVVLEYQIVKKELATQDFQDGSLND